MNILIDADGCPVVDLTLQIAKRFVVPVIILCDTAHQIEREGAQTLVFDKGADSVDFALVNRVKSGDVVVTQDYGLASMCLAKCARVLNQNGLEYTADNMDALMLRRYENKKLLRAGHRTENLNPDSRMSSGNYPSHCSLRLSCCPPFHRDYTRTNRINIRRIYPDPANWNYRNIRTKGIPIR